MLNLQTQDSTVRNFLQFTSKKTKFQLTSLFLMFALLLFFGVLLVEKNLVHFNLFYSSLLLIITTAICIFSIRRLPRIGFNFFDPGLVFVSYIAIVIMPVTLIALFDFDLIQLRYSGRFVDIDLYSKTLLAHVFFLGSFGSSYMILSLSYKNNHQSCLSKFTKNKIWPMLAFSLFLYNLIIRYYLGFFNVNPWIEGGTHVLGQQVKSIGLFGGQILHKLFLVENILLIVGIGVIVARSSSLKVARIKLITILFVLFVLNYFFTTERGIILIVGLGAASYADIVRWKGELLNFRLVLLGIICGFVFNLITSIIESAVIYGKVDPTASYTIVDWYAIAGGVASVWITSTVISWIDNLYIPMQYGQNYLNAIKSILPSQLYSEPTVTLTNWFMNLFLPQRAEMGIAFGFSPVAEGYLNARMVGVFLHGLIIGSLAAAIRYLQFGARFKVYGVFFFSVLFSGFYKVYHLGSAAILQGVQWKILLTIFVIFVGHVFLAAEKRKEVLR